MPAAVWKFFCAVLFCKAGILELFAMDQALSLVNVE